MASHMASHAGQLVEGGVWDTSCLASDPEETHAIDKAMRFLWQSRENMFPPSFEAIKWHTWMRRWRMIIGMGGSEEDWLRNWVKLQSGEELDEPAEVPAPGSAEAKFQADALSVWGRVFVLLDGAGRSAKNGVLEKDELDIFFRGKTVFAPASAQGHKAEAWFKEDGDDGGRAGEETKVTESEQLKQSTTAMAITQKLTSRFSRIREDIYEEQRRACRVGMTDKQVTRFVHELGSAKVSVLHNQVDQLDSSVLMESLVSEPPPFMSGPGSAPKASGGWLSADHPAPRGDGRAELQLAVSFILRGEVDKLDFGDTGGDPVEAFGRDLAEDLREAAGSFVSVSAKEDLSARVAAAGPAAQDAAAPYFKSMVDEGEFRRAYATAVGVDPVTDHPVWAPLQDLFNGVVPKRVFFAQCRRQRSQEGSREELHYAREYTSHQLGDIRTQLNLMLFLIFAVLYVHFLFHDQGLGPGHYQNKAQDDYIEQELAGARAGFGETLGVAKGAPSTGYWFGWHFHDIAEEHHIWTFLETLLGFAYPSFGEEDGMDLTQAPGTRKRVPPWGANYIIGGLKLQQWRTAPVECADRMQPVFDNNIDEACYTSADARRASEPNQPETIECTPGEGSCSKPCVGVRPFDSSNRKSHPREIKMTKLPWASAEIAFEIARWLLEEELGVRMVMNFTSEHFTINDAILAVAKGSDGGGTDAALEIWEITRTTAITRMLATGKAQKIGVPFGVTAKSAWFVSRGALVKCPGCIFYQALRDAYKAAIFSPNGSLAVGAVGPDGDLGLNKGQVWDLDPSVGWATSGFDLIRGLELTKTMRIANSQSTREHAERIKRANMNGEPLAFYWFVPDPLIAQVDVEIMVLPEFRMDLCGKPAPPPATVEDGETRNDTLTCDFPTENLIKLANIAKMESMPDVQQLLTMLTYTTEEIAEMLRRTTVGISSRDAACEWLQANRNKWNNWVRSPAVRKARDREEEFFARCFPPWDSSCPAWATCAGDTESYTEHAHFLATRRRRVATSPCRDDPMDFSTKVIVDPITGLGQRLPCTGRWREMARNASVGGSVEAELAWRRFEPWHYQSCEELSAGSVAGQQRQMGVIPAGIMPRRYSCGGYSMILPISLTYSEAKRKLIELRDNEWIDIATRMIMVEFFTYGQNTAQISRERYYIEVSASGGMETSEESALFRLWQWEMHEPVQFCILAALTLLLMSFFFLQSVAGMWQDCIDRRQQLSTRASMGHGHWKGHYTHLLKLIVEMVRVVVVQQDADFFDFGIFIILYAVWAIRFWVMAIGLTSSNILCTERYPVDYNEVADLSLTAVQLDGLVAIFVALRLIIFLKINRNINLILRAVKLSGTSIVYLLIVFLLVMTGFSFCGWVLFGHYVHEYNGFLETFSALLMMMLGEAGDYEKMFEERKASAPIFFFLFWAIVTVVLLNLTIAVVSMAYDQASHEMFDKDAFVARVHNDPSADSSTWMPSEEGSLVDNQVYREIKYWLLRLVRGACGGDMPGRAVCPRLLWKELGDILAGMESEDITVVLRSYSDFKQLKAAHHVVQDHPSAGLFAPGDPALVRDSEDDWWRKGVVVAEDTAAGVLVRPHGWRFAYQWRSVMKDAPVLEGQFVRLLVPVILGAGKEGGAGSPPRAQQPRPTHSARLADAPAGAREVLLQAEERCLVLAPGDGSSVLLRYFAPPAAVHVGSPHAPRVFWADTAWVRADVDNLASWGDGTGEPGTVGVSARSVGEYLDGEFGPSRRRNLCFLLAELPAKVLGMNLTTAYVKLFDHHHFWKGSESVRTKFGPEQGDELAEILRRLQATERITLTQETKIRGLRWLAVSQQQMIRGLRLELRGPVGGGGGAGDGGAPVAGAADAAGPAPSWTPTQQLPAERSDGTTGAAAPAHLPGVPPTTSNRTSAAEPAGRSAAAPRVAVVSSAAPRSSADSDNPLLPLP